MTTAKRKPGLDRQTMALRCAREFQDGWIVNLGIGIPTLCSNAVPEGRTVIFQSENGVIGYGPLATPETLDLHLVNAGVQHVTLQPFASIVHHADAFGLIRSGRIDVSVLGAYEVAENGDFANWKVAGKRGGGIGGAMDLAACAKRVYIIMEHVTRDGKPRLLKRCTLPITAPGVVKMVFTDLGVMEVGPQGFILKEIAPGWTPEEVQALTEARLHIPRDLTQVAL
ncbi:MAG: 3-oxoacid CoA-transferase subunit B [Chloroflexi bacterium]|nr:3-oxoacid CoA-transferase subunit B [Chloroflexota bacterium]